ncbi:TIGR02281 family clan AA aspartic protease [Allosphingosinicella sp.]|uniref:retropepsin-like aspartic protease family protein n=1 Tax=Allosphingosinicella sp. TaxID=2823234 RepID=UPI00378401D9
MVLAWVLIFASLFAIFALRDDFRALGNRLWAAVTGTDGQEVQGGELRIAMADDGHFWANGEINGRAARFLIDSGATVTTIGPELARNAGVEPTGDRTMVDTANGIAQVDRARASLTLGPIQRQDLAVFIAREDATNVIGMNFLSTLSRWSVEGRTLVLRP